MFLIVAVLFLVPHVGYGEHECADEHAVQRSLHYALYYAGNTEDYHQCQHDEKHDFKYLFHSDVMFCCSSIVYQRARL